MRPGGDVTSGNGEYLLLQDFLSTFLARSPQVRSYSILSGEGGKVVFSTDTTEEGQYRVLDREFTEGMKWTSIQNVHPSPITLEPTMCISTPVLDAGGSAVGVLVVSLNLESMDRIIQDRTGLGKTGRGIPR